MGGWGGERVGCRWTRQHPDATSPADEVDPGLIAGEWVVGGPARPGRQAFAACGRVQNGREGRRVHQLQPPTGLPNPQSLSPGHPAADPRTRWTRSTRACSLFPSAATAMSTCGRSQRASSSQRCARGGVQIKGARDPRGVGKGREGGCSSLKPVCSSWGHAILGGCTSCVAASACPDCGAHSREPCATQQAPGSRHLAHACWSPA